jgi:hypothetical protein
VKKGEHGKKVVVTRDGKEQFVVLFRRDQTESAAEVVARHEAKRAANRAKMEAERAAEKAAGHAARQARTRKRTVAAGIAPEPVKAAPAAFHGYHGWRTENRQQVPDHRDIPAAAAASVAREPMFGPRGQAIVAGAGRLVADSVLRAYEATAWAAACFCDAYSTRAAARHAASANAAR